MSPPTAALALLVVFAARADAHWAAPEDIVAELNGPEGRAAGVARATRDEKTNRLLVIRVGEVWSRLPAGQRRDQAAAWLERWRHSVSRGVVSILDARTDRPVVAFGAAGKVVSVVPEPTIAETHP